MLWYKFEFNEKQLNDGAPLIIRTIINNEIKEERKNMQNSPLPSFYRSKIDDNIFFLKIVGWDIEKEIIQKYSGLPREERFLPPLEEFFNALYFCIVNFAYNQRLNTDRRIKAVEDVKS